MSIEVHLRATTQSGTVYEFRQVDGAIYVRRTGGDELRRDDEWLRVQDVTTPEIGSRIVMALEPLGEGDVTYRTTTPVTDIGYGNGEDDE